MGRFVTIGPADRPVTPYYWVPGKAAPRFVTLAKAAPVEREVIAAPVPEPEPEPCAPPTPIPEPEITAPAPVVAPPPPVQLARPAAPAPRAPLSRNLLSIRRKLSLTPEEFARPIIEDGEGLINRLEAGLSRPSAEIGNMICETWGICSAYLYTGAGAMFLKDDTEIAEKYVILLTALLKTYLSVATFDRRGNQYWKASLVDDLSRLIDVKKLDGRGMSRVIRVLYDYLDVDQFAEILERFGR